MVALSQGLRWIALLVVATMALSLPVGAQESAAVAEALFKQGRDAMKAGDYAVACDKFVESERIDPQVGTRINIASCSEKLGKLATAWALYQGVRDELPADDDRRPIAEERLAALSDLVPRLKLVLAPGAPADTVVSIGKTEVRGAGFGAPLPVDPGEVQLQVSAPAHVGQQLSITLAVGEQKSVVVSPGAAKPVAAPPLTPAPAATPVPQPPPPADAGGSNGQAIAGYVFIAVGVASILAGVGTGIAGLDKESVGDDPAHCNDDLGVCDQEGKDANDDARALLTTTTVTWVAGAVLAGLGLTLVLTSPDDGAETALVTDASPNGAGIRLIQRF